MPLPNVSSKILSKVIEYCKYHVVSVSRPSAAQPRPRRPPPRRVAADADAGAALCGRRMPRRRGRTASPWPRRRRRSSGTRSSSKLTRARCSSSSWRVERRRAGASREGGLPSGPCHLRARAHPRPLQAANYLNIKALLDLTCQTVANMIKGASRHADAVLLAEKRLRFLAHLSGKTPEEIRKTFNIKNDFSPVCGQRVALNVPFLTTHQHRRKRRRRSAARTSGVRRTRAGAALWRRGFSRACPFPAHSVRVSASTNTNHRASRRNHHAQNLAIGQCSACFNQRRRHQTTLSKKSKTFSARPSVSRPRHMLPTQRSMCVCVSMSMFPFVNVRRCAPPRPSC